MTVEIAIDVGGTFTDLYLRDAEGEAAFKVPTTADPAEGVFDALETAAAAREHSVETLLAASERFVHGTTIATNAIIEDEVDETAFVTTDGFRDTLLLREGGKEDPYDWSADYPDPYVPREYTFGVEERVNAEGGVETPLSEADVRDAAASMRAFDVESVAVCLLWSHVNPEHEQRVGEILAEELPDVHCSLSHRVNPITREYRRAVSTAIDASLHGPMDSYLSRIASGLDARGYDGDPLVVTANGGVMEIDEVRRTPIWTVDSGPTMLPVAARELVADEFGTEDVIALDMGGTSLDMAVVRDGDVPRTREAEIGDDILGVEKVEVRSIGSGGGSIARVDEGGLLHVGPESAGADPGPACYGRGGTDPTVTDAALVLGFLNPDYFLGGEMSIDPDAARNALGAGVADPLGLDITEAAWAVYGTANRTMTNGIEAVTVERGVDPRGYVLAGGGGALGTHAVEIARDLQIEDVLFPSGAGVVSAVGALSSNIRRDFSASHFVRSDRFERERDAVNDTLAALERKATAFHDRIEVPEPRRSIRFHAEARYSEQVWELEVELPASRLDVEVETALVDRFHAAHRATYGFEVEEQPVEFLRFRAEAIGDTDPAVGPSVDNSAKNDAETARHGAREAQFEDRSVTARAYRGSRLGPGHEIEGPAVVDAEHTTIVLPPGSDLRVTDRGNFHVRP